MTKVRGQKYPAISLADAVLKVRLIHEQERDLTLDEVTIAKALNYSVTTTDFTSVVSALIKYGLLQSIEPSLFKVSEDAENIILLSRGHPDRVKALKNIAFKPYLFSKLHEFSNEQAPSNELLRSLLLKMGFTSKTMENVIHSYLETLKFIQSEEAFVPTNLELDKQLAKDLGLAHSSEANSSYLTNSNTTHVSQAGFFGQTLLYRIGLDCMARIEFDGPVTQEGIAKLVALLELNVDVFPKRG